MRVEADCRKGEKYRFCNEQLSVAVLVRGQKLHLGLFAQTTDLPCLGPFRSRSTLGCLSMLRAKIVLLMTWLTLRFAEAKIGEL